MTLLRVRAPEIDAVPPTSNMVLVTFPGLMPSLEEEEVNSKLPETLDEPERVMLLAVRDPLRVVEPVTSRLERVAEEDTDRVSVSTLWGFIVTEPTPLVLVEGKLITVGTLLSWELRVLNLESRSESLESREANVSEGRDWISRIISRMVWGFDVVSGFDIRVSGLDS